MSVSTNDYKEVPTMPESRHEMHEEMFDRIGGETLLHRGIEYRQSGDLWVSAVPVHSRKRGWHVCHNDRCGCGRLTGDPS